MAGNNDILIADRSRGIAYITYDVNGNPQNIYFTNGNETRYVYSATGQKLRVVHYTAAPNITRTFGVQPAELTQAQVLYKDSTDYLLGGSLVMKNGRTDKVLFDGGYAQATYVNSTSDSFSFRYYNKDHLGNNREVESMRGSVYQVTNYYPFGAPFVESTSYFKPDYQPYKYNGKELDLMHGLNTYDYGARQYDPILARWDRVDPLCEKYHGISPYAYCGNNPILFLDFYGYEPILPQAGTAKGFVNTLCTTGTLSGNMRGAYAHNAMLKFGDIMLHFPRILPANTGKINNYKDKYIYTQKGGWIDMCHFMFYAGRAYKKRVDKAESKKITNSKAYIFMDSYTQMLLINQAYQSPVGEALQEGYFQEMTDRFFAPHSAYSYEDLPSDKFGAEFGAEYFNPDSNLSLGEQLLMYLNDVLGATTPDKAPNYETLPTEEPSSSPSKTNHTTNPIYTSY